MSLLRKITAALWVAAVPVQACDLALLLAVDVSGSVDGEEYRVQMDGLATALRDPVISEALVQAQAQLSLVQWTGTSRQSVTIPWTGIDGFAALERFAVAVESDPRVWRHYSTAIGEVLSVAVDLFAPVMHCHRRMIDLSGDGPSNEGISPTGVHARLRDAGIVVNALAIEESEPDLTAYFFENVIRGEGAFVVTAPGFADYPDRIRKKLLREVVLQSAGRDTDPQTVPQRSEILSRN
jgi:Ca-activated chloride channel family protein